VVILHGSGRENRSGGWFLGEQLAASGMVVLVYDKRGMGKSTGDWKTAGPEDLANDSVDRTIRRCSETRDHTMAAARADPARRASAGCPASES
jgi:hypothetical protein